MKKTSYLPMLNPVPCPAYQTIYTDELLNKVADQHSDPILGSGFVHATTSLKVNFDVGRLT